MLRVDVIQIVSCWGPTLSSAPCPGHRCACLGGTVPERGDAAALTELYQVGTSAPLGTQREPRHHICSFLF